MEICIDFPNGVATVRKSDYLENKTSYQYGEGKNSEQRIDF